MAKIVLDDHGELDQYVENYLKDTVQQHVREILNHQLKDVVAGELARLRMVEPSSSTLSDVLTDVLQFKIDTRFKQLLAPAVRVEMQKHFRVMAEKV